MNIEDATTKGDRGPAPALGLRDDPGSSEAEIAIYEVEAIVLALECVAGSDDDKRGFAINALAGIARERIATLRALCWPKPESPEASP